jgi:hypothetical protein
VGVPDQIRRHPDPAALVAPDGKGPGEGPRHPRPDLHLIYAAPSLRTGLPAAGQLVGVPDIADLLPLCASLGVARISQRRTGPPVEAQLVDVPDLPFALCCGSRISVNGVRDCRWRANSWVSQISSPTEQRYPLHPSLTSR